MVKVERVFFVLLRVALIAGAGYIAGCYFGMWRCLKIYAERDVTMIYTELIESAREGRKPSRTIIPERLLTNDLRESDVRQNLASSFSSAEASYGAPKSFEIVWIGHAMFPTPRIVNVRVQRTSLVTEETLIGMSDIGFEQVTIRPMK